MLFRYLSEMEPSSVTWVLGSGIPFGYGALISDVRVSWEGGRTLDGLQKIYPIGPGLMAGFAGSVAVGFWMIYLMQRQWSAAPGTLYPVKRMAWHWHRFARWFYREKVRPEVKRFGGSELMIVGVSPEVNGPFGLRSHAVFMKAPDFAPQYVKVWTWGSIGSGAGHAEAADFRDVDTFWNIWAQGEIHNPGGTAFSAATSVAGSLERQPMASVSPILQIGTVRGNDHSIVNLKYERRGAFAIASEEQVASHQLITSWSQFEAAAAAVGLDATAAVT